MNANRDIAIPSILQAYRLLICFFAVFFLIGRPSYAAGQNPPPVPSLVSATQGTYPGGVRVWWTPVDGANAYDIWRSDVADESTAQYFASVPGSSLEFIDSSIPPNKSYHYWVRTVIVAGVPSAFGYSHEGYWRPGPAAPGNVQASDALYAYGVYITWNESSSATGYEVWRNSVDNSATAVKIGTREKTAFWDPYIDMQNTYYYWVKAYNQEGTSEFSWSNPGFAKPAPPMFVAGLTASSGQFLDKILIEWDPARGASRYEIWRADGSEKWMSERIGEVSGSTSYEDTETEALHEYTYWVRAVNSVGYGNFSAPASGFREVKLPAKPTSITASEGMFAGRVNVRWTSGERAIEFEVLRNEVRDLVSAELIARIPALEGLNEYWDTTAEVGRVYFYWVRGINNAGSGETSGANIGYWNPGPDAPTNVQASDGTLPDSVEVGWIADANASSYEIWRHSVDDKSDAKLIGTSWANSYLDDTAVAGEMYFYWVKASNSMGTSGFSWADSGYAKGPDPVSRSIKVSSATGAEGSIVTLTVDLTTPGHENALAFSLNFDPNLLEFHSLSGGAGLPSGSMLIENHASANEGRIGAAVALAPGNQFDKGSFELLQIEFVVQPGSGGSLVPVIFADNPSPRDIVGMAAETLPAQWLHGGIDATDPTAPGYEADVSPIPEGDGKVSLQDWVQIGRWVAGLDPAPSGSLFQRADCAPRNTLGDGSLALTDWVQAGRYLQGLDPLTAVELAPAPQSASFSTLSVSAMTAAIYQAEAPTPAPVTVMMGSIFERNMVPVLIDSDGNVNAVSFTVEFDATAFEYGEAVLGPEIGDSGGILILNDQHSTEGRLGVMVAMPSGQSIPIGIRKVLDLHLAPRDAESPESFNLEFTDVLLALSVSDPEACLLNADFRSGTLTVADPDPKQAQPPRLQAHLGKGNGEISLSWESILGRTYRVERSTDLSSWQSVDRVTGQPDSTELRKWIGTDSQVFIRVLEE